MVSASRVPAWKQSVPPSVNAPRQTRAPADRMPAGHGSGRIHAQLPLDDASSRGSCGRVRGFGCPGGMRQVGTGGGARPARGTYAPPMRFGAAIWTNRTTWPALRDVAGRIEESGFDSLWADDHLPADEGDWSD